MRVAPARVGQKKVVRLLANGISGRPPEQAQNHSEDDWIENVAQHNQESKHEEHKGPVVEVDQRVRADNKPGVVKYGNCAKRAPPEHSSIAVKVFRWPDGKVERQRADRDRLHTYPIAQDHARQVDQGDELGHALPALRGVDEELGGVPGHRLLLQKKGPSPGHHGQQSHEHGGGHYDQDEHCHLRSGGYRREVHGRETSHCTRGRSHVHRLKEAHLWVKRKH
mmetsp:Transcript_87782/g.248713  ORF Transcript_87782/g.248713 Transcript_87782/m.248713 type:complete len:223 (+) Transcript_87782:777-1445(+)